MKEIVYGLLACSFVPFASLSSAKSSDSKSLEITSHLRAYV
jgi:hypothetical protein